MDTNPFLDPYQTAKDEGIQRYHLKCNDNNSGPENFVQNDALHSDNNNQGNKGICRVDKFEVINNSGMTCEEEAKRRNSGAKTMTFEGNCHLLLYTVSNKEDMAYLKGQPKLGLWYPKDSSFDLVAYTDSDYAGASLDRKSTIGAVWNGIGVNAGNSKLMLLGKNLLLLMKVNAVRHKLTIVDEKKPAEYEGFEQIVDFLNANPIKYALTVNPTIYTSCIEQLWATAKAKTINGEVHLQALVDGKKMIITKTSVRRDLQLEDADGIDCLPNAAIFEQLTLMGKYKKKDNEIPQSSVLSDPIAAEAVNKENVPTHSNDPLLSGENSLKLEELMALCTNLQNRVLDLEHTKTTQALEIESLKRREDASKHGRKIDDINADEGVTLVDEIDVAKKEVSTVDPVTTAGEVVTTASVEVSTTSPIADELTLAQTLIEIKSAKPKFKRVVIEEQSESTITTTTITRPKAKGLVIQEKEQASTPASTPITSSKDKGKGIMVEEPLKMKKKDQVLFDKQEAIRLQAQFDEEDRIAREKEEANVALIAQWNDI
ncbi:hypothetical protein Tco_0240771 [Tanacetum coccineum]